MPEKDPKPTTLTLIVTADGEAPDYMADFDALYQPGRGEMSAPFTGPIKYIRRKLTAKKQVNLDDVKDQLNAIQGELDCLLESLPTPKKGPFGLSEVEVGLSITAEGSIGIATVGGEISLTLTFARQD
jgi:hypothetical protein